MCEPWEVDEANPVYREGVIKMLDGIKASDIYRRILLGDKIDSKNVKIDDIKNTSMVDGSKVKIALANHH